MMEFDSYEYYNSGGLFYLKINDHVIISNQKGLEDIDNEMRKLLNKYKI